MDMLVKSESLTSVADAIRTKGETTEQLVFPADFVTAIHAIQSGGEKPQLIVTAPEGSTITAVNGDETVTGMVGAEGTLTLDLPAFGTWTVTGTLDGQEANTSVDIEQEYPVSLSYITTFTVNGGYNETVTVYHEGESIGSVTLEPTGTGTLELSGCAGKTLVFTGGSSGYEKTVSVGIDDAYTVDVYPDDALFWYGRQFEEKTGGWHGRGWKQFDAGHTKHSPSVANNADGSITFSWVKTSSTGYVSCGAFETIKDIDLTNVSKIEVDLDYNASFTYGDPPLYLIVVPRNATYWQTSMLASQDMRYGSRILTLDKTINGAYDIAFAYSANESESMHGTGTLAIKLKTVRVYYG